MPELPDSTDILRGLEMIRSALVAPGNVGDALPRAVDRATEVTASIDRLTDEVAKLNANVERALPLLESFDQHAQRAIPVIESLQQAEPGLVSLLRTRRRAARENDAGDATEGQGRAPEADARPRRTAGAKAEGAGPGDR